MPKKNLKRFSKSYQIQPKDFEMIERGVELVLDGKLKDIFPRGGLENTDIETFDSEYIYLCSKNKYNLPKTKKYSSKRFEIYEIKHKTKLRPEEFKIATNGRSHFEKIGNLLRNLKLPLKNLDLNLISITPFGGYFKFFNKQRRLYAENYLCNFIIHEYAHIYFKIHAEPNVSLNYNLFKKIALNSEKAWINKSSRAVIDFPIFPYIPHLYASLAEYFCAEKFFPLYHKKWQTRSIKIIKFFTKNEENLKKWYLKGPLLDVYFFDLIYVPLVKNIWPNWPEKLLKM